MKIEKIIIKYLNHEANIHELETLDKWLKEKNNEFVFSSYVKTNFLSQITMDQYDLNAAKKALKKSIQQQKRSTKIVVYRNILIAATVVPILLMGFYWKSNKADFFPDATVTKSEKTIQVGENKAILTLGNGNQVVLGEGKSYKDNQLSSNGEKIRYNKKGGYEQKQYNQLSVPKGGQFYIELADGTEVWLNSDSKIKYPTKFEKGKTRKVELIYGEAFFKVANSKLHDGAAFNVNTKFQDVQVLGTEFNIKAYAEDNEIKTTLIEGKVQVSKNAITKLLKPNQQSIISNESESISITEIDPKHEVAWVEGLFSFNDEPLEDIMKTLSRWYDIEIVFENAEKKKYTFTGIVERSESIYDLLELIERTSNNHIKFEANEKNIIIK